MLVSASTSSTFSRGGTPTRTTNVSKFDINLNLVDPAEIVAGLKRTLGLILAREEIYVFVNYLDEDRSGGISFKEFSDKVNFKDYQKRSHKFLVSEKSFIDRILSIWYDYRAKEKERLHTFILSFDDNGDKII